MASLRKDAAGVWFVDFREGDARRRVYLHVGRGEKRRPVRDEGVARVLFEALQREEALRETLARKDAEQGVRVRAVVRFFLEEYLPGVNAAPKTRGAYQTHLDAFERYLSAKRLGRVHQVTGRVMLGFGAWLREDKRGAIGERTVGHYLATVRAMFTAAFEHGLIAELPVRKWTMPEYAEPEVVVFTPRNLGLTLELLRGADEDLWRVCAWMAATGQRPSDAVAICPRHIDGERWTVERTTVKVKRLKKFPLTPPAVALVGPLLAAEPEPDAPLFRSRGRAWTVNALSKRIERIQRVVKFPQPWSAKMFRSTFGTMMANEPIRMPLPDLQVIMGHHDVTTTMKYVKAGNALEARERFAEVWGAMASGSESEAGEAGKSKKKAG